MRLPCRSCSTSAAARDRESRRACYAAASTELEDEVATTHRPSPLYLLNDGVLYAETLDRRHLCGNALRMNAAWSVVAALCATGSILSDSP